MAGESSDAGPSADPTIAGLGAGTGELPRTGFGALVPLTGYGLVLAGLGTTFRLASRRRRSGVQL